MTTQDVLGFSLSDSRKLSVECYSMGCAEDCLIYQILTAARFSDVSHVALPDTFDTTDWADLPDDLADPYESPLLSELISANIERRPALIIVCCPDDRQIVLVQESTGRTYGSLSSSQQIALITDFVISKRNEGKTKSSVDLSPNRLTGNHYVLASATAISAVSAIVRNTRLRPARKSVSSTEHSGEKSPIDLIRARGAASRSEKNQDSAGLQSDVRTRATTRQSAYLQMVDELPPGVDSISATVDRLGLESFVLAADRGKVYFLPSASSEVNSAISMLYLCEYSAEYSESDLLDYLAGAYMQYGYFAEKHFELTAGRDGQDKLRDAFDSIRTSPPAEISGVVIREVHDYCSQEKLSIPGRETIGELPFPAYDVFTLHGTHESCNVRVTMSIASNNSRLDADIFAVEPTPRGWSAQRWEVDVRIARVADALEQLAENIAQLPSRSFVKMERSAPSAAPLADFDFASWVTRLEEFLQSLQDNDSNGSMTFERNAPASDDEIWFVEKQIGMELPASLRRWLSGVSSSLSFSYSREVDVLAEQEASGQLNLQTTAEGAEGILNVRHLAGEFENAKSIIPFVSKYGIDDAPKPEHPLPLMCLGNGDYVAVDLAVNGGESAVLYLSHEEQSYKVASSWCDFLDRWEKARYSLAGIS